MKIHCSSATIIGTFLLVFASSHCYTQPSYAARLASKLDEMRKLRYFDNGVVVYTDSNSYGSTFPRWNPNYMFYEDDVATFPGGLAYAALSNNQGKNPATSPQYWKLIYGPHPYLFLRDSATTQDLERLLSSDHPYIRCYAFGSLAQRNYPKLFQVVFDNLADTTKIEQMTSDYGYTVYPADLMLWCCVDKFSLSERESLQKQIITKYQHLITLEQILLFHEAIPDDYNAIMEIARKRQHGMAGLVALSKYKSEQVVELIRPGFTDITNGGGCYYGSDVFFLAIENFPHPSFKEQLVSYKERISLSGGDYYLNALAAYHDADCLRILEEFFDRCSQNSDDPTWDVATRTDDLSRIYHALKKHYSPMYDDLISKIKSEAGEQNPLTYVDPTSNNPWNLSNDG